MLLLNNALDLRAAEREEGGLLTKNELFALEMKAIPSIVVRLVYIHTLFKRRQYVQCGYPMKGVFHWAISHFVYCLNYAGFLIIVSSSCTRDMDS